MNTASIVPTVVLVLAIVTAVESAAPVWAANRQTECGQTEAASKVEPATPPDMQSADGTAPGNGGSTGWTGGTGGAHIGTNPAGSTPHSKTWQPPTARGLDLAKAPPQQMPPKC
jgi:hypothetical protein